MPAKENPLKRALQGDRMLTGCWLTMGDPMATDIAASAGFDWCLIDGEHGPFDVRTIRTQLMILAGRGMPAIVRVPAQDDWIIKQVMDAGANAILVPMVDTAHQAKAVVRATRYPPVGAPEGGTRGIAGFLAPVSDYGAIADYVTTANDQICVIAQIESAQALENIEDIAAVPGIDALFIGPGDLLASLGRLDQQSTLAGKSVIADAIARIRAAGTRAGMLSFDPVEIETYRSMGVNLLAVAGDVTAMATRLRELAQLGKGGAQ